MNILVCFTVIPELEMLIDDERRRGDIAIAARNAAIDRFDVRAITRIFEAKLEELEFGGSVA